MRIIARAIAAASVLALVSACGSAGDGAGSSPVAGSGEPPHVVTVTVHQTGGLKPTDETRVFSEGAAPPVGFTRQDVDAVIARADALAASGVTPPKLPQSPCCDLYAYDITLTFSDGDSMHFAVSDGVKQAKPLEELLAAVS